MRARGVLRQTRCFESRYRTHTLPSCILQWTSDDSSYARPPLLARTWARGAKRKTTVQASSLPQGVLSPLPKTSDDAVPEKSYPPVLQQHLNNVRKFNDCVVLTRVGDFYEMYFDQVDRYAPLVNLKKAKRATALGDVAMAGFQHTQLDRYLKMFVQDLGKQVAISEQIRLPQSERSAKVGAPMYDRKVTRVITAGTLIDENFMDPFENNYLLGVHVEGALSGSLAEGQSSDESKRSIKIGLSWLDLSSGSFFTQAGDLASLPSLIARIGPREVVFDASIEDAAQAQLQALLGEGGHSVHYHTSAQTAEAIEDWADLLEEPVPEDAQSAFSRPEIVAGGLILDYVREKLLDTRIRLQQPVRCSSDEYMTIDKQSLRGLEIRSTLKDGLQKGSLLHTIRRTVTKSGARLLSQRLVSPSMSLAMINSRLDLVQEFLHQDGLQEHITALLRNSSDTYRLLQKFSIGRGDADDMLSLAKTIDIVQQISIVLHEHVLSQLDSSSESSSPTNDATGPLSDHGCLWELLGRFDLKRPLKVAKSIQSTIDEDSLSRQHEAEEEQVLEAERMAEEVIAADTAGEPGPNKARRASKQSTAASAKGGDQDIWIMRRNASPTLDNAHAGLDKLYQDKHELATRLRTEANTESLTLKWTPQLGHFCHVKSTKSSISSIPGARAIGSTKSTRTFHVPDWTTLGTRIDDAKLRIRAEEDRVFTKLRNEVLANLMRLRRNAAILDELDVACSSATIAKERNLIRPTLNSSTTHKIINGRHPTVDVGLREQGRQFTANDCLVGSPSEKIYLITGPNMAGKSTYLRQNALITILAQTGCFVPADYAELGLVDKIFSRVGSADNLFQDQSTFMVEMLETAEILKQATPRSFVIMDEVGRGTTPEDGIAVGYACLHYLHNVNKCRALFATHFHALADMTRGFGELACYCTDVAEEGDGSWAYVHRLSKGVNRRSHALKVARLAGLPEEAIAVAGQVLHGFERGGNGDEPSIRATDRSKAAAAG